MRQERAPYTSDKGDSLCMNRDVAFVDELAKCLQHEKENNIGNKIRKLAEQLEESSLNQREILKLNRIYQREFYNFSSQFEKWAAYRRQLLKKLDAFAKKIEYTKECCSKGRITFSSVSVVASASSLVLDQFKVSWSSKLLLAAAAIGSLNLVCSLIELYTCKYTVEDIIRLFLADKEEFEALEREIRHSVINDNIRTLFPYGVNNKVVKKMLDPKMIEFEELKKYKNLVHDVSSASQDEKIFFAILISNVLRDSHLLNDKEFLSRVRTFSKSKVAEKWWNRLKYKNSSHHSEKSKLYSEIKSSLKLDSLSIPVLSLAAFPLTSSDTLPAFGIVILNSIVIFDTFCELSVKIESKESSNFRRLGRVLREEYDELRMVYGILSPYND